MRDRARITVLLLAILPLLAATASCGGDGQEERSGKPVEGTFVGRLEGTNAFVAVVASPVERGKDRRDVTVYVSDGRRLSESFAASARGNSFSASSDGSAAETKGELGPDTARGSVELPGGKTVRYEAARATGAAGLYDVSVSAKGGLRGASATGVGLTGATPLRNHGTGNLKLADGTRQKLAVVGGDAGRLRAGQARLIVLSDGALRGAGMRRAAGRGVDAGFFIRSTS